MGVLIQQYGSLRTLISPLRERSHFFFAIAKNNAHQVVLWSIESGEWGVFSDQPTDEKILRMSEDIKDNDIVLMHDNCEEVVVLLEHLLPIWLGKGIKFADPYIEFS